MKNINIKALLSGTVMLVAVLCLNTATAWAQTTRYVATTGTAAADGLSWGAASNDLQAMINASAAGDEIWVAAGTYKPTHTAEYWTATSPTGVNVNPSDRFNSFVLKAGVKIYGGFTGNDYTETVASRDWAANVTTLSGDFKGDDYGDAMNGFFNMTENAYHVVIGANIANDGETVLDGFTISGGNANNSSSNIVVNSINSVNQGVGGGMYNNKSSPALANVAISGNSAAGSGGGMFNRDYSSPALSNVAISGNSANVGGGMYNYTYSSPSLSNVTISGNYAYTSGGGIENYENSSPALINVIISGNYAGYYGGGMYNGKSSPALINVTISGNNGNISGGGMFNNNYSSPVLTNVTISGNSASNTGGMFNDNNSSPVLANSIIWGNVSISGSYNNVYNNSASSVPSYAYSLVQGSGGSGSWQSSFGTDNGNNLDDDPRFENWINPVQGGWTATSDGDYRLQPGSLCIDAGYNSNYLTARGIADFTTGEKDLGGKLRLYGTGIDMGAYEYHPPIVPDGNCIVYVTVNGAGNKDGSSWKDAYPGLADPLLFAKTATCDLQIWVAQGVYHPQHNAADVPTANDRDRAFVLVEGVKIYGGFKGDDDAETVASRDWATNVTTLSGDFDGDDGGDAMSGFTGMTENAYHVVIGVNIANDGETVLDGFTISGGNANGNSNISVNANSVDQNGGGGMYNYNSSPALANVAISGNSTSGAGGGMYNLTNSSPVLSNVTISGNRANIGGGGMYNNNSSPALANVAISGNNTSGGAGGGMYNDTNSSPSLTNVTVSGNSAATIGGGMYNYINSSPSLTNVTVSGNSAAGSGGGIENYGNSSPALINVIISGNSAGTSGGGMYNYDNSSPALTNVTISGNSADTNGGGMYNSDNSSPALTNSIIWGNVTINGSDRNVYNLNGSYAYSLVEGSGGSGSGSWQSSFGTDNGNNLDGDPRFENWIDPAQGGWTSNTDGDYRLQSASPAINAGDSALYKTARNIADFTAEKDLGGNPRLVSTNIDMGAYEVTPVSTNPETGTVLDFDLYAIQEWNNTWFVNIRKLTAEGYAIVSCRWFEKQPNAAETELGVSTDPVSGFSWSKGPNSTDVFVAGAEYRFVLELADGSIVRSSARIFAPVVRSSALSVYPNPAVQGEPITVEADMPDEWMHDAIIRIYSSAGQLVREKRINGKNTQINISSRGMFIIKVKEQEAKIIIK
ncbi:hypothetical protein FACS189464_1650 [Bacteroidia bacterium]|nr:hypothetical protein FACS189464_1650 [Bacteroidia bacterium]